ncbi:MAG: ThuA domain-containing protein, partial [Stackebrandtia sp.]
MLTEIGQHNGLTVEASADPAVFTTANLDRYRGVVFLSAQGVTLTRDQETALQTYIRAGGGFLGISDAAKAQIDSTWFTGLIGSRPAGARLVPEPVAQVTANAENPPNETKEKLIDGNDQSKWLAFTTTGWAAFRLTNPAAVNGYALTSANDAPTRDPKDWTLQGSQDGTTWVDLDRRTGQVFDDRFQTKKYDFTNTTAYAHYRLDITANSGATLIQLAEVRLFTGASTPPPEPPTARSVVNLVDRQHPANKGLPLNLTRTDRWINWEPNPVGTVHTVAQVEERHYTPGQGANGPFHPVSWCRDYDGGRSFYTGMGGVEGAYRDGAFRTHLTGALLWTTGLVRADCQATIAANYKVERLTVANQTGQLDQVGEPHGMAIAPDGSVYYVGKAACANNAVPQPNDWVNPNIGLGCGTLHRFDPHTKQVKLLTTLPVMGNRGGGSE